MLIEPISISKQSVGNSTNSLLLSAYSDQDFYKSIARIVEKEYESFYFSTDPYSLGDDGIIMENVNRDLQEHGQRWIQGLAFGESAGVLQLLAQRMPKVVRRLVFVNAITSSAPTIFEKIISNIETFVPCGLPLRSKGLRHDTRGLLHRIHCPCLVVVTRDADSYARSQAMLMQDRIPNSWFVELDSTVSSDEFPEKLLACIKDFENIPAKFPQKNLR